MDRQSAHKRLLKTGSPSFGDHRSCLTSSCVKSASHLDLTRGNDGAVKEVLSDDDERKGMGTRYITEDLIKKLTKQDNLALVRSLNLSSKHGDKHFRYIENLDRCDYLQVLNLSYNSIERIEKMETLHKLQELHLSYNRIQKIEGLEHMASLQILNLAHNSIEHVPLWLSKKLRSLHTLNLQNNKIFSLHELSKLKPLRNLTELMVADNPVYDLPHYRLFLIFHLRSLEELDGVQISEHEREKANQRFHTEEIDRLEQELEKRDAEIEQLQREKAEALKELEKQEELQQNLWQQSEEQMQHQDELERELNTKSELLKQKTTELTRACQKQYELEQELAFHKIDAKFEPLSFHPSHELEEDTLPGESPYIGKARHRRRILALDSIEMGDKRLTTEGLSQTDSTMENASRHALERAAEERLQQLQKDIESTEEKLLRASEELRQLEEATSQKRMLEAEKEHLSHQLWGKVQRLGELRKEAEALEKQQDKHSTEQDQTQGELERLQSLLHTLEPEDPRHTHVKGQVASKSQLLAIMNRKHRELEGRLDDILTRITKEAQEIKDLEQQLTEGQIAANEDLKQELEGIIGGLQEYLHGVKNEARRAQSDCLRLQRENDKLHHRLQDKEKLLSQLQQEAVQISKTTKELLQHQKEMEALRHENVELRQTQSQVSTYKDKLEAQLQESHIEAGQLKEELGRLRRLIQLEHSALQAELQKERQAKENALAQLQLAAERELENNELLQQFTALQEEKGKLLEKVNSLQNDLQQVRSELLCPKQVVKRLEELKRSIAKGSGKLRLSEDGDLLGESFAELQEELHCTVSAALRDRDEAQRSQDRLAHEVASLRDKLRKYQQKYQSACEEAEQARAAERCGEEAELLQVRKELQEVQEQQYLMLQRLQETESERDHLLMELEEQDKQMKAEEAHTQEHLQSLDLELQALRRSFSAADRMAAQQLNAAKDQLRSLHSTVQQISQERAEDAEELKESKIQAAQAMQDLTRAENEIQVLQKLLKDRAHIMDTDGASVTHSSISQQELARLNQALKRQKVQTKRLKDQLAQSKEDNSGHLQDILEEIEALRDTLLQQNNYLSGFVNAPRNEGQWYYVPPNQNPPSLGSQGTYDSGLGSQHLPSPDKGRHSRGRWRKETKPPSNAGYWVYSPCPHDTHTQEGRDPSVSDGESEDDIRRTRFTPPPGSVIYTVPPNGTHLPQGTVIYAPPLPGLTVIPGAVFYGPPPDGAKLVYGPPPRGLQIPLFPNGTLHCNIPGHQDLERSLREMEHSFKKQRSDRAGEQELRRLEEQRSDVELELKELRRTMNRLQRHKKLLESSVSRAEEEQYVVGEVDCLEKTLAKRKTELRETERLLLEAESDLKDIKAKTKDTLQSCSDAKRRLQATEHELEEIEVQTQNNARQLVHTKQQLRDLQEEVKDLQKQKQDQEKTLQDVERVIASRDAEFQDIRRNLERARIKLDAQQDELRERQSLEAQLLKSCRDAEVLLNLRKKELEQVKTEVHLQQEELSLLGMKLEQWHKEESLMRESVEKHRKSLVGVLREGEQDANSLQEQVKTLRGDVQALAVQKGELEFQLSERKSRLAQLKTEEEQQEQESAQNLRSIINKHKSELKDVLEMIHMKSVELEDLKVQHKQKVDQLEKSQETLLQAKMEMKTVEQKVHEQQERQRRLQEQCSNLEARRTHAQRCLEAAEEGAQAAETEVLELRTQLAKLKQEYRHAQSLHEEISRATVTTERELEERSEGLNKLKDQVAHSELKLKEIRKEVEDVQQERDDLAKQNQELKAELKSRTEKIQRRQQRADKLELHLKELEVAVSQKEAQFKQQEEHTKAQQQQSSELQKLQKQQQQKVQSQLQAIEEALAQRVEKMEEITVAVEDLQEKRHFLQADQQHSALLQERVEQLEEELAKREVRLRARTEEVRKVREELEACHSELRHLKDTLAVERRNTEAWLVSVKNLSLADNEKSQGEGDSLLQEIKDTVQVRVDLDSSMNELALQPMASSGTDSYKESHLSDLLTVKNTTYTTKDELWRGEALRERLRQHEDHLKAQLRRTMFSQNEVLSLRRQQTEGSIQGLRRRVEKLDQLLGISNHDSPYLSDSQIHTKYSSSGIESWKHQRKREHSFSPIRLDPSVPEKDPACLQNHVH
ncbi:centriolin-like isoform X2 [Hoplias malabaricus]|uniref:centriolin-like isoform X2 n=1 Tax=Hoplias malabaricus TaxID=27720 RepID=UPI0034623A3D